ncbi:hypothetical protein H6G04_30045 [Calothrix membranacea FACHB-236]|nr:hypothetical protein [Calothrix membranacea FACHB-236]
MVCWQGNFGILEVDGPHHTPATASEEQERDRLFRHYGIKVTEHFSASRCDREPEKVVDEFLKLIEKMY